MTDPFTLSRRMRAYAKKAKRMAERTERAVVCTHIDAVFRTVHSMAAGYSESRIDCPNCGSILCVRLDELRGVSDTEVTVDWVKRVYAAVPDQTARRRIFFGSNLLRWM